MQREKWLIFVMFALCISFCSCERVAGKLDSKPAEEPFAIQRFDRLQNELAVTGNFTTMQRMNTEFPRQTQILIEDVLELGSVVDEDSKDKLVNSLGDTAMLLLMADGESVFGDMKDLNKQFGDAIKLMRKELPLLPTPRIYSQYSGLNESIVVSDSLVGFSIDKYMGIDYPLYKKYFYDHQIVTMSPERIVTDCLFYYLKDNYPLPDDAAGTLLENMVLMGKLNWITCKLTHGNRLEDMLGLTSEDMQWIKDNRAKLLDYLKAHYNSTDPQVLRNLLNNTYNPTIGGKRSPGLLGVWVGFQMVNQYMKNHQHLSLQELATANNIAEIAAAYNYKIE